MPKFTAYFGIAKKQAEIDFVDIDIDTDTPLYLDPYALTTREDDWSDQCHDQIVSYFMTVLESVKNGDKSRAVSLLSRLAEPFDTHLGVSVDSNRGRGIGHTQATDLYASLSQSKAAKTGLLEDLSDFALFIPGIGRDKISDMATNVIRKSLIEYTQAQCAIHRVPMSNVASGFYWDVANQRWTQSYTNLPIVNDERILLVPKYSVRYQIGVDSNRYRSKFVLEFLQAEHLQAGSALVTVLKDKKGRVRKKVVYKKDVDKATPKGKDFLAEFSLGHPELLDSYRRQLKEASSKIPVIDELNFNEGDFCKYLIEKLRAIPSGSKHANDYHDLCFSLLSFIFFPNLIYPKKENEINQGRKRIDIAYTNGKESGIFYRLSQDARVAANLISVECKNYSEDIHNPEIDQLVGRLDPNRGRLGILCFRNSDNLNLIIQRCNDVAKQLNGIVLPMDDNFLINCLELIADGNRKSIDLITNDLYVKVIS